MGNLRLIEEPVQPSLRISTSTTPATSTTTTTSQKQEEKKPETFWDKVVNFVRGLFGPREPLPDDYWGRTPENEPIYPDEEPRPVTSGGGTRPGTGGSGSGGTKPIAEEQPKPPQPPQSTNYMMYGFIALIAVLVIVVIIVLRRK
jgi:hypothetical protein